VTSIERVEWATYAQPLGGAAPLFALPETATVHVRVTAGGVTGGGYAYCWHSGVARALQMLGLELSRSLNRRDPASWNAELRPEIERGYVNFLGTEGMAAVVVSALDIAMWDWHCRSRGLPLESLLGRPSGPAPCYVSDALWPSVPPDRCAEIALAFVESGFAALKIWVGSPDLDHELRRVRTVRDTVGPDVGILVDANQTYEARQAVALAERIAPLDVTWFEDPVPKDDLAGLAWVCERAPLPIATGENAWGANGLRRLLDAAPIDVALLDLQRIGGISGWLDAAAQCHAADVTVTTHTFGHVGARLLAGEPAGGGVVEFMPPLADVFGSMALDGGRLVPPDGPGALPLPLASVEWVAVPAP
jgi:L-alanine-DL-glutamate epimerase-like enolase superfamily enzyme